MTELVPDYCECNADGIWTIIQKRFDGSVDFYRSWVDYKEGFGCLNGEFWLGNELIHLITSNASYILKIVLTDWENVTKFAQYDTFRIADEADGYRLTIGGYSGDAGDSLTSYHNGFMFSTHDRDNDGYADKECAETYTGAWWYDACFVSNLNGRFYFRPDGHVPDGIFWWSWRGGQSLKETQLMLRKVNTGTSEAATNPPSTLYTSSASISSRQTDTNTLNTNEQTFAVDNATSSPSLSCTIGSTVALPLDISAVNSDLCQNVTSDVCTTMTEMVPDYCECDADGIWTIIQKRFDGSVDFYRSWMDYKEGFGCLNGEYWLGNDLIHLMTSNASYTLKIVLTDWENVTKFAQYDTFRISDEADGYRLTIGGYSGDAGDSLISYHNGFMFSTKDRDTGPYAYKKCAQFYTGAWWYRSCFVSNLNGRYYFPPDGHLSDGIIWWSWRRKNYSLKATKLMIKPN